MNQQRHTVAQWRKERAMTQMQLAIATGMSLSTIASIEARRQDVTMTNAEKIAAALGVTTADIAWPSVEDVQAARARTKRGKEAA